MDYTCAQLQHMLLRIKSFIIGTEAINSELKAESVLILDRVLEPSPDAENLELLSCFQFIKSVVNGSKYAPSEFLEVLKVLEYLTIFEMTLQKEAKENGEKD